MTAPLDPTPGEDITPSLPAVVAEIRRVLDLRDDLAECGDRLDRAKAAMLARSASVLLRHHHDGPAVRMPVAGPEPKRRGTYDVHCHDITAAMRASYPVTATETVDDAACGVALSLAADILQARFLRRASEGDGFDYFFSPAGEGDPMDPFVDDVGLEVSGIRQERGTNTIRRRAAEKAKQARSRWTTLRTYAIVVEFSQPATVIVAA